MGEHASADDGDSRRIQTNEGDSRQRMNVRPVNRQSKGTPY